MAIVDQTYVDPSALAKLYLHEKGSREVATWRRKNEGPIIVTHHGRTELINAICISSFVGALDDATRAQALSDVADDFARGDLKQADILWRSALNRAAELSQRFTPTLGTRSLDVLHVACALELQHRYLLSTDQRQRRLAASVGLKLIDL